MRGREENMFKRLYRIFTVFVLILISLSFVSCNQNNLKKNNPSTFFIVLADNFNHEYKLSHGTVEDSSIIDTFEHKNYFTYDTTEGKLAFQVYGPYNSDGTKMKEEYYQLVWDVSESDPIDLSKEGTYKVSHSYYINYYNKNGKVYHAYTVIFEINVYIKSSK